MANPGKDFEKDWKDSYDKTPHYFLRLVDSNKFDFGEQTRFTPKNPYDSLQYALPFLWLLELKSTQGTSMSFRGNTPMIKEKQLEALVEGTYKPGVIPGLILNFRETDKRENTVYFVHIIDFMKFVGSTDKASINEADCAKIGIKVQGVKKKVHYRYIIDQFIHDSLCMCLNREYITLPILKQIRNFIDILIETKEHNTPWVHISSIKEALKEE